MTVGAAMMLVVAAACSDGSESDPNALCEIWADGEALGPSDITEKSPSEVEEFFVEVGELADAGIRVAPSEIRMDVEQIAAGLHAVLPVYEAADFVVSQLDQEDLETWVADYGEQQDESRAAVDEWVEENCATRV